MFTKFEVHVYILTFNIYSYTFLNTQYVETYKLYRYFWDDKHDIQNIHAFSIYEIVVPILSIVRTYKYMYIYVRRTLYVRNVVCDLRALRAFLII